MTIELKVEKRDKLGKLDNLRKSGLIPAVFYGKKQESTPIQIKKSDFLKTWKQAGESTVISLNLDGKKVEALIKNIDMDPVLHEPRHADFYVFEKGHMVEINVPLEFEGIPLAVKELGGILVKVLHELRIKADPSNLPHQILVDVSNMDTLDSQITVKDIKLPSGVTVVDDLNEVVASISVAKEEKENVEIDLSAIEVEQKGKKEEATDTTNS